MRETVLRHVPSHELEHHSTFSPFAWVLERHADRRAAAERERVRQELDALAGAP